MMKRWMDGWINGRDTEYKAGSGDGILSSSIFPFSRLFSLLRRRFMGVRCILRKWSERTILAD